jgi:DNA-binding MarR family transcriptional regulator
VRLHLADTGRERFAKHHALHRPLTRALAAGLAPAEAAPLARSLRDMAG